MDYFPQIHPHWPAVLVSVVASFAIGGVWYGPLFGKVWAKAMGFPEDMKPTGAEIAKGSVINLVGTFLIAFVMAHEVAIWRPSTWGLQAAHPDQPHYMYGVMAALFWWLGFVVPMLLNGVAFERKSWKVFAIGAVYQLISFMAIANILSYWR